MEQAVNRVKPRGGVAIPITRFVHMITPKCMGDTPMAWDRGSKAGKVITIAEVVSRKHPRIKSRIFIIKRVKYLFVVID